MRLRQARKKIKESIKKFDLFSQQVTFRYNDQPAYQTLTGGIVSIILIAIFIGIFSTTMYRTVAKQYIDYKQSRHDQQSPSYFSTPLNSSFMFAIGIDNVDLNAGDRYFDISMQFRQYNSTHKLKYNKPLKQCTKSQWQLIGFGSVYDKLNLTRWLCPQTNFVIQLEGKFTSDVFKFYRFVVSKCNATLDLTRPCVTNTTIQTYLNANEAFNFNFYFINTIINAGDQQYLKQYLQDVNYFPFSTTAGINANLYVSTYNIETDQSLWPVEQLKTDKGGIVLQTAQNLNYGVRGNDYVKFYLRKSPLELLIQRQFRRIDDTLSYIGGLFSTLLVCLMFLSFYGQLCYELQITKSVYYLDKNDPINSDQFNIFTFFIYLIFLLFDKIGIELNWKKYKRFHKFLEDGRKQLDMRLVLRKIMYAEKLGMTILDQNKYKGLFLQEPLTLEQAQKTRKDMRFYKNFRKKYFPNGQLVEQDYDIISLGMASKQQFPSSQYLNQSGQFKGFKLNNKVKPLPEDFIPKETNLSDQQLVPNKQRKNTQYKTYQIRHQQEFEQLDKQMKLYILELKEQAEKGDIIANRIFEKIDPRIKKKYLPYGERRLNMSMSLKKLV